MEDHHKNLPIFAQNLQIRQNPEQATLFLPIIFINQPLVESTTVENAAQDHS